MSQDFLSGFLARLYLPTDNIGAVFLIFSAAKRLQPPTKVPPSGSSSCAKGWKRLISSGFVRHLSLSSLLRRVCSPPPHDAYPAGTAEPPSAVPCFRTTAVSDDSPPAAAMGRNSVLHSASTLPSTLRWPPERTSKSHSVGVPKRLASGGCIKNAQAIGRTVLPQKISAGAFPIRH
jgi:hypothetical protein